MKPKNKTIKTHIVSVVLRLLQLERRIEVEQRRPAPDRFQLLRMKKIRLQMKDRLARMLQPMPELAYARLPTERRKI